MDHKNYTVTVIAELNDHDASANEFSNNWRKLINTIIDKFRPSLIFVPKTIGSIINRFINNQINNQNQALYKIISSFIHPSIQIASPYLDLPFNRFCKDGIHFSFYGNHMFACSITRLFEFFTR